MKRIFKRALFSLLFFFILLTAIIFIGSIDRSGYDDLELLDVLRDVPDAQNGYREIARLIDENTQIFSNEADRQFLAQHVVLETWDDEFASTAVAKNSEYILVLERTSRYDELKLPPMKDGQEFIDYVLFVDIFRLALLNSMLEARAGNYDQAIAQASTAVQFAELIKSDANGWLISYMIGIVMQYEYLIWLQELGTRFDLSSEQYARLEGVFESVPTYSEDSFVEVLSGEFVFTYETIETNYEKAFAERRASYQYLPVSSEDGKAVREAYQFMEALIPRYYIHEKRIRHESAKWFSQLASQSQSYCSDLKFGEGNGEIRYSWIDIVTPNSYLNHWLEVRSSFEVYFERRCLGHAHLAAARTAIAIARYEREKGVLVSNLQSLVPEYLSSLPVDPFDGRTLRFSASGRYLYSVGVNIEDNGGASESNFERYCFRNSDCATNPTFSEIPIVRY